MNKPVERKTWQALRAEPEYPLVRARYPRGPIVSYRYTYHHEDGWWVCHVPALNITINIADRGVIVEMLREEIAAVMRYDVQLVDVHTKEPPP